MSNIGKLNGHAVERLQIDVGAVHRKNKVDDSSDQLGVGGAAGIHVGAQLSHALCHSPSHQVPDVRADMVAYVPHALLKRGKGKAC